NHLAANSDRDALQEMVEEVREKHGRIRIEFEADTLDQVRQFLAIKGIDIILLDNMSTEEMIEAVRLGAGRVEFEASGNVSLDTVAKIAGTGVDFISVGALTHSAPAIDFSLEVV
ncbi:MAG: nicotinate-nucleotide diphosphorylase (carboxylating), partial [Verrucomicrobiota bacterium]|nr:nicotinate-nucleotide diphosphorylase (carboxylating) [Verrucomicrobiota bacterium]